MDFIEELKNLSTKIEKQKDFIGSEDATKNACVVPFIELLEYDVSDLTEVMPEFTADFGTKQGEKVDYAIFKDNEVIMLIECKKFGTDLSDDHTAQLYRYFSVTHPPIAVLTNGALYRFYTDLEKSNVMDMKPFLEFNLLDIQESLVNELKRFTKSAFDLNAIRMAAGDLKYSKEIKQILVEQLETPTEEFVQFFLSSIYSGERTQAVVQQFTGIVKRTLNQFLDEQINQRSQSVANNGEVSEESVEVEESDASTEQEGEHWTAERFKTLVSESEYRDFYESKHQIEKLCEFGADLMALLERKQWELTDKFNKSYFALYFRGKRVFGVNLFARPKLAVWLPADVLAECNNDLFDGQHTYTYYDSHGCGIYPEHATVANIEKVLEFAYSYRAGLL